jgi:hypothetical protein
VADRYPPTKQRAALKKLAAAINSSSAALRIDECGDPRIVGSSGHVYAVPRGYQMFVMTETPRAWTAAKRALGFASICNDGDEEGALILDRLPTPAEAQVIRRYVGIRKRRTLSEEARADLLARFRAPIKGGSQAPELAPDHAEARS